MFDTWLRLDINSFLHIDVNTVDQTDQHYHEYGQS